MCCIPEHKRNSEVGQELKLRVYLTPKARRFEIKLAPEIAITHDSVASYWAES